MKTFLLFLFFFSIAFSLYGKGVSDEQIRHLQERNRRTNLLIRDRSNGEHFNNLSSNILQPLNPRQTISGSGVETAWVRHHGAGDAFPDFVADAVAIDSSGNVYVVGTRLATVDGLLDFAGDIVIIKYDPYGELFWERHSTMDYARSTSVAIDGEDNVVVLQTTSGVHLFAYPGFQGDFGTIKYDPNGDTLWMKRYPNYDYSVFDPSSSATALAIDHLKNIIVTGESYDDYATIKYDTDGDTIWIRRYDGSEYDKPSAMVVGGNGNVYVTGASYLFGSAYDYATVAYNFQGDTIWVRRYNGPLGNGWDKPTSIAIDGSGNVYVTGGSEGLGTYTDYVTIKYSPNGSTLWIKRLERLGEDVPLSLAADESGNVFVTGYSSIFPNYDFVTVKYAANGDTLWTRHYTGDYYGDVDLALDKYGNAYLTFPSDSEIVTMKYTPAGNEEWIAKYSYGSGTTNSPVAIKVDKTGNVYVVGTSSWGGQSVFTVIKYTQITTSLRDTESGVPSQFVLEQNYPNPFNPSTTIRYSLSSSAQVKLTIYNILGQVVCELANEEQSAGWKEVRWNAKDVASGIYFYKLHAGNLSAGSGQSFVEVKKMLLVR